MSDSVCNNHDIIKLSLWSYGGVRVQLVMKTVVYFFLVPVQYYGTKLRQTMETVTCYSDPVNDILDPSVKVAT